MESFINKNEMVAELKKRGLDARSDVNIYSNHPIEYAGQWKYKYPPLQGKEAVTPVEVDLIRKYQKLAL